MSTILSSVSNTIDSQSFYDELETQPAISKMKMLIGATSIIPPDEEDDLWSTGKPWHMQIDIHNLENLVNNIESEISATARTKATGVTPERLSKIWSIDIETAKKTINLTSQHVKHEGSDYFKRRYSTNDRML